MQTYRNELSRRTPVPQYDDILSLQVKLVVPLSRMNDFPLKSSSIERRICRTRQSAYSTDENVTGFFPFFSVREVFDREGPDVRRTREFGVADQVGVNERGRDGIFLDYSVPVREDFGGRGPLGIEFFRWRELDKIECFSAERRNRRRGEKKGKNVCDVLIRSRARSGLGHEYGKREGTVR